MHGKLIRTYSSLVYKTSPCDPAMNGASNGRSMRARLPTAGMGMRGYPKAILGWARIVATYLPTRREAFPMDAIRTDGSDSAPCVRTR